MEMNEGQQRMRAREWQIEQWRGGGMKKDVDFKRFVSAVESRGEERV